jgi:methylisocitrate lyase
MERAEVAAIHLRIRSRQSVAPPAEQPRVAVDEMCDRLKAAVDAATRRRPWSWRARTHSPAKDGPRHERAGAYVEAGADMIFAEALYTLDDYSAFTRAIRVPVLANLTEFGLTPSFTVAELDKAGVKIVLYPLSAFRAMSRAALRVYETIRRDGTQRALLDAMQTRDELYAVLDYHTYERKLDELNAKGAGSEAGAARKPVRKPARRRARKR